MIVGIFAITSISLGNTVNSEGNESAAYCDEHTHVHGVKQYAKSAKTTFALKHWKNGPKPQAKKTLKHIKKCAADLKAAKKMQAIKKAKSYRLNLYRDYRSIATIRCHSGKYGFYAIPCYIIACESGFSWNAYNPSGARGVYQFLGWNVPWPVRGLKDKIAHHKMAIYLWNDSPSHWVCV